MASFHGLEGPLTSEKSFPHNHLWEKLKRGQLGFDFLLKYFFSFRVFSLFLRSWSRWDERSAARGRGGGTGRLIRQPLPICQKSTKVTREQT